MKSRNKRIEDFMEHPRFIKAWAKNADKYLKSHPDSKGAKLFADGYEYLYYNIFSDSVAQFNEMKNSLFGTPDFKKLLLEYFKIEE